MKYTHADDHQHFEKIADMVTVNLKKVYTAPQLAKQAELLANAVQDKEQIELNKKEAVSEFKNQIDAATSNIKKLSNRVANGFEYADTPAVMYLDFENKRRVFFDPHTLDYLEDQEFKASDYQKEIDFNANEERLDNEDIARQSQIEENNSAGDFAEGLHLDRNGNLTDIPDALDAVIGAKKSGKVKKEKPAPKDNLAPEYGKHHEPEDELPASDMFAKVEDEDAFPE